MLVLTDNAATTIRNLIDRPELPDLGGLRIAGAEDGSGRLTVSTATTAEQGDEVIEDQGARVFLEPVAADVLDDKVLDTSMDEQGRISFVLGPQ
jgi:iron-sulfur cluster assembly protein